MRGVILTITLVIQVAYGQLLLSDDERGEEISRAVNELMLPGPARVQRQNDHDEHHHHHTHVTRLDVTCDDRGMRVNLEFDHPFDGVVFSKGHFGNPRCRFVNKDSARSGFSFMIDANECGTIKEDRRELRNCPGCDNREAIIVVQNEESVQEIWDTARRIRCPQNKNKIVKKVSFNPFEVARLEIEEVRSEETTNVECWMNIQKGKTPFGGAINGQVRIGEELTAVVYIKDGGSNYDIKVKDCFAHDRADLLAQNVTSLRLSDERGCPSKQKLMGFFTRTSETGSTGANLIAFAPIHAFKFADRADVYLTCVVELCAGGCEGHCPIGSERNEITVTPPTKTTTRFVCRPGSTDPRCPTPAPPTTTQRTTTPFVCTPGSRDYRCPQPTTPRPTTQFVCFPGSRDPRCPTPPPPPPTTTQFVCTPGSRDYRCPQPTTTTTQRTTTQFVCTPGSRDYRCPTPAPRATTPRTTTPFVCSPFSRDPRCPRPTTQRPTTQFVCLPGSRDFRCPTPPPPPPTTTQFVCTPGSRDYRCPQPTTTTQRPTTQFVCLPGIRDYRCPTPPPPPPTTTKFVCTPGSRDYRCPQPTTTTQRPTTQFVCTPGSRDPRCPTPPPPPPTTTQFVCTPGSRDYRCPQPTTTTQRTTTPFVCTPDSTDSRCPQKRREPAQSICYSNPNAPGCVEFYEDKKFHAFHAWQQPAAGRGRRIYTGKRPSFASQRRRRDVNEKPEVLTITVSTGFHMINNN